MTCLWTMQHELLRVLYPVFVHCYMDVVAKGNIQEGMLWASSLYHVLYLKLDILKWPISATVVTSLFCFIMLLRPQLELFSIASGKTTKCCTHETFKSWKAFFLPLIWRLVQYQTFILHFTFSSHFCKKKNCHDHNLYQEMEFAHSLRQSKVNIKICQVVSWIFFCHFVRYKNSIYQFIQIVE